jgi:ABC-type multidrug transport system ATPase subunit
MSLAVAEQESHRACSRWSTSASSRDRRAGALSHGQVKRVGVAQAFLGAPELILLDEPTAGLDPRHAHDLRALIREPARPGPSSYRRTTSRSSRPSATRPPSWRRA